MQALLVIWAATVPSVYAMDSAAPTLSLHAAISREALSSTFSDANLKLAIQANESQDAPGSEASSERRRHFEGTSLSASVGYMNREQNRALNLAAEADTDAEARRDALRHLGLMFHSAQDFYLHTNYVELQIEDEVQRNDPYNMPLVDWTKVPNGYAGPRSGKPLIGAGSADSADPLNKDSATAGGGRITIGGNISEFSIAREMALRETQRQWKIFEKLVKNRCGSRAGAVLNALCHADPAIVPPGAAEKSDSEKF